MRLLLDESAPKRLKLWFPAEEVSTVVEMGWGGVKNGKLLRLANEAFDVFVTADKALKHQQNLAGIKIGVVELPTNHWPSLQPFKDRVVEAARLVKAGQVLSVDAP